MIAEDLCIAGDSAGPARIDGWLGVDAGTDLRHGRTDGSAPERVLCGTCGVPRRGHQYGAFGGAVRRRKRYRTRQPAATWCNNGLRHRSIGRDFRRDHACRSNEKKPSKAPPLGEIDTANLTLPEQTAIVSLRAVNTGGINEDRNCWNEKRSTRLDPRWKKPALTVSRQKARFPQIPCSCAQKTAHLTPC